MGCIPEAVLTFHFHYRLFPKLPLFAGVLITAVDVLFVLVFFQHPESGRRGMMAFEGLIVCLVMCVFFCFIILLVQIKPDWSDVFQGFLPSKVRCCQGTRETLD